MTLVVKVMPRAGFDPASPTRKASILSTLIGQFDRAILPGPLGRASREHQLEVCPWKASSDSILRGSDGAGARAAASTTMAVGDAVDNPKCLHRQHEN